MRPRNAISTIYIEKFFKLEFFMKTYKTLFVMCYNDFQISAAPSLEAKRATERL